MHTWFDVPALVCSQLAIIGPETAPLVKVAQECRRHVYAVWYEPTLKEAAVAATSPLVTLRFCDVPGIKHVHATPPTHGDWVLCKHAGANYGLPEAWNAMTAPLGGPNPLSTMIVGSVLGSGLGYAGGSLIGLPFGGRVRKRLQTAGMRLGALPGLAAGAGWGALQYMRDPSYPTQTLSERGAGWTQSWPFEKRSEDPTGALLLPSIPVDAFNQAVWNDVHAVPNPFGTKSPWGDNEQPMGTPAPVAAAVSGLLAGASAARGGSEYVSPLDVGLAAAVGGGKGLLAGLLLGKTVGALAGISPSSQRMLQQVGFWGGALSAAAKAAFGL